MSKKRFPALFKATFAVMVWGASFIATKVALREVTPMVLVWMRFGIGVVILGVAVTVRRELFLPLAKELWYFALLGFLGIAFHQWLQSNGLVTAQATTTAWIVATVPIFIAVMGRFVLKETLGVAVIGGIALAAAGVLLVVSHGDTTFFVRMHLETSGDLLILISSVNWAVFSVLSRRGLKKHPASSMMLYVMAFGWGVSTLAMFAENGFALGRFLSTVSTLGLAGWSSVVFLGVFCSGLAYIFWYDALKQLPASQIGALIYLEPLVAVTVAAAVLEEPVLPSTAVGGALILFGVWIVNRR